MKSPTAANGAAAFLSSVPTYDALLVGQNLYVILYRKRVFFYNDGKTRTTKKEAKNKTRSMRKIKN